MSRLYTPVAIGVFALVIIIIVVATIQRPGWHNDVISYARQHTIYMKEAKKNDELHHTNYEGNTNVSRKIYSAAPTVGFTQTPMDSFDGMTETRPCTNSNENVSITSLLPKNDAADSFAAANVKVGDTQDYIQALSQGDQMRMTSCGTLKLPNLQLRSDPVVSQEAPTVLRSDYAQDNQILTYSTYFGK